MAIGIVIALAPTAVGVTLFSMPLLRWIEAHFGVEVIGHSGPAQWVYLSIYVFLVIVVTLVWQWRRIKTQQKI